MRLTTLPIIFVEEREQIQQEIKGKYLSVVYDGTSRLGEVLVIVARYVHEREIHQHLVRVDLLAKSKTGDEVAHHFFLQL